MQKLKVAVVGAGMSGLACARTLQAAGAAVVVFEKSRSLGGRLATRRWEGHVVDHGAPWFSEVPQELWAICQGQLSRVPTPVWDRVHGKNLPEPEGGRWYLPAGNNRIGKMLAEGLEVRLEAPVESLKGRTNGRWDVGGESFDAVVLTAPWPQSRRLPGSGWAEIADAAGPPYRRTLTAFFEYKCEPSGRAAQWSGMEQRAEGTGLERSVCENHKTGRVLPGRTVIVAHGTPEFSEENSAADPEGWAGRLELEVREAWGLATPPQAVFTHRWGFATIERPFEEVPDFPSGIFLAGDAVCGSSVGAVYDSGVAVAHAVLMGG